MARVVGALPSMIEFMNIAARLAREAGDAVATGRRHGIGQWNTKSTATDLVTPWDTFSESLIREQLGRIRPADGIHGEEGDSISGTSGVTWIIDPIDGTTNFAYGLAGYAVSIAAVDHSGTLAGAVYLPESRELFVAARGRGAWLSGSRLSCSRQDRISLALVGTGFSYESTRRQRQFDDLSKHGAGLRDIRRLGAASADLCYVACGRLDAYFETNLQVWDFAAGALIAMESGALVTNFAGSEVTPSEVLACGPGIHTELVGMLSA